jgi:hypothetical protein
MSDLWFYARNKQKLGPVSTDELRQLLRDGTLQPHDMVLRQGAVTWVSAGSAIPPSAPEAPAAEVRRAPRDATPQRPPAAPRAGKRAAPTSPLLWAGIAGGGVLALLLGGLVGFFVGKRAGGEAPAEPLAANKADAAKALAEKLAAEQQTAATKALLEQALADRKSDEAKLKELSAALGKALADRQAAEEELRKLKAVAAKDTKPDFPGEKPGAEPVSLRGDTTKIDDLTLTPVKLDAKLLLPRLSWADAKGSAFFTADEHGVVQRISFPDLKLERVKDFERKCTGLAVSSEGVLLSFPDPQQVWLLDPRSLDVRKKIDVPGVRAVAATPASHVGVAAGEKIYAVDLKTGVAHACTLPENASVGVGFNGPVMTADGQYVFTTGLEAMCRFKIVDGKLRYEETSPRIAHGHVAVGVQVSPDSKLVCLPSRNGNYVSKGYGVYLYPVTTFQKSELLLDPGPHPAAVAFDPVAGYIYASGAGGPFTVFTPTGIPKKSYKVPGNEPRQYLVHPGGSKVLLLIDNKLLLAEVPPKIRPASGRRADRPSLLASGPVGGDYVSASSSFCATSRSPIGSESPSIWLCSSPSSSVTSSTMRTQCSGTRCDRSAASTLARWASSTSRARCPLRRASCVRQNAHASRSLSWPGSKSRIESSHAWATSGCTTAFSGP